MNGSSREHPRGLIMYSTHIYTHTGQIINSPTLIYEKTHGGNLKSKFEFKLEFKLNLFAPISTLHLSLGWTRHVRVAFILFFYFFAHIFDSMILPCNKSLTHTASQCQEYIFSRWSKFILLTQFTHCTFTSPVKAVIECSTHSFIHSFGIWTGEGNLLPTNCCNKQSPLIHHLHLHWHLQRQGKQARGGH